MNSGKNIRTITFTYLFKLLSNEKGLIYITAGNLTSAILGAIFWLILAAILKVADYGEVNYIIAIASILTSIALLGLNTTITTYLAKGETEVTYEAHVILFISTITIALIAFLHNWETSLLLISMAFYTASIANILGGKRYTEYALTQVGQRLLQILLSTLLYLNLGLTGIILGYAFSFATFSYRYIITLPNLSLKFTSLKGKTAFILHSYGLNLINSSSNFIDKIIIGSTYDFYHLGLYQLGFQFLMFLGIIPSSMYIYLLPEESSGESKKEVKIIGVITSIVLALIMAIISPIIVKTLFPKYVEAVQMIQVMSVAVIPLTLVNVSNATLLAKEKSKQVFIGGIIFLALQIPLLILLGKALGTIGLAIALTLSRSTQTIYALIETLHA